MLRTIIDTAGIIVVLFIGMIGFMPGAAQGLTDAWAKNPLELITFLAQLFTVIWGLLASIIVFSRTLGPVLEAQVRAKIVAKKAKAADVAGN